MRFNVTPNTPHRHLHFTEHHAEHTLNCYGWFPEHIRVFQQLRLVSVHSNDLTASVQNSAVAQPEVTHSACTHSTQRNTSLETLNDLLLYSLLMFL